MNTETSLILQFVYFAVCGAFLGLGYEALRILRAALPHGNFAIGIEDTVYLSLCGLVLFGFSMETGSGRFRFFYLVSAFIGAVIYYFTAGRLIRMIYLPVVRLIRTVLCFAAGKTAAFFAVIFGFIAHKMSFVFVKVYKVSHDKLKTAYNHLQIKRKVRYNNRNTIKVRNETAIEKPRIKATITKE